ncbi:MAG: DoxX family protein [Tidjanibacter sp.]|nr:DoxX family protein [Tidjanibacter sp.]
MNSKLKYIADVARWVVGIVFVFSAAVKMIDPYGMVLKMDEYYAAMGIDWMAALGSVPAVVLIGAEMFMGCALLLGALPRLTAVVVLLFNIFYLLLTLWSAIANPVAECGCFGDVLPMSNWASFGKNVVLTLLSVALYCSPKGRRGVWREVVCALVGVAAIGFTIYSLVALPVVEKFPFGVGVNMVDAIEKEMLAAKEESTVVCRNVATGEEHRFGVEDPTWWDESQWEFVKLESPEEKVRVKATDFALYVGPHDLTLQVLSAPRCRLVCVERLDRLSLRQLTRLRGLIQEFIDHEERVWLVTSSPLREADKLFPAMEFCNMDAVALRALLRAPVGVVTLRGGVIVHKATLP